MSTTKKTTTASKKEFPAIPKDTTKKEVQTPTKEAIASKKEAPTEDKQLQELYDLTNILDNAINKGADELAKYEASFSSIFNYVKGGPQAKKFVAQLIPRYLKHFPKLSGKAIDCLIDLCEERTLEVRVHAVKAFPLICKDIPSTISKCVFVLSQLLQSDTALELDNVKSSLLSLIKLDPNQSIQELTKKIDSGGKKERERVLLFMKEKISEMKSDINEEFQKLIAIQLKNLIPKSSSVEEFSSICNLLFTFKYYRSSSVIEILDSFSKSVKLGENFKENEQKDVSNLILLLKSASPYFEKKVVSDSFFNILVLVLTNWESVSENNKLPMLEGLAQLSPFFSNDQSQSLFPIFFERIFLFHISKDTNDKLNFSLVEAILYIFHQLGSKSIDLLPQICGVYVEGHSPKFLQLSENELTKLQEFRLRLTNIKTKLASKPLETLSQSNEVPNDNIKLISRVVSNIDQLSQGLLKPKLVLSTTGVIPSWIPQTGEKRKADESSSVQPNKPTKKQNSSRPEGVYIPPKKTPSFQSNTNNNFNQFQKKKFGGSKRGGRF